MTCQYLFFNDSCTSCLFSILSPSLYFSALPISSYRPYFSSLFLYIGWTVVHPFNTVCVRMNLASAVAASSGNATASLSFPSYLSMTIREQGAMSLYSGLSAGLLRQIFYTTSRLGLFEVFRDEMAKYRPTDIWSRLSTGMVSGGNYIFIYSVFPYSLLFNSVLFSVQCSLFSPYFFNMFHSILCGCLFMC